MDDPPADTAPIRPEERFDEARVAAYLRDHLPDLVGDGPIAFEQFPGGRANLTYLVRAGGGELVLRRPPLGPVAPGSHDMAREHAVLSVLHRAYPPAPRAYLLCTDPGVMGAPFFVMERRRGTVVRESWPASLPATDAFRRRLGENVVDALANLHRVDYRALGLEGLGRPEGFVARQVAGWVDRWNRAKDVEVPAMEELGAWFPGAVPAPQGAVLLHNDFKLDNLIVSGSGEVVAVLDWDMATLGDPLIDLGSTLAYWAEPGDALYALFSSGGGSLSGVMPRSGVVERYGAATGFDATGLAFYHAFGLFRVAVIIQQIYLRYRRGQTSDARFVVLGALVPLLAEEARRAAGG
ncbi:MAG: phosphotransferase family protein [Actinobacteria bacterium]|nr:phosphotransferase family protein [Actinomycetota bacterium]